MKLQKLYRYVRQAADEYNLIEDGDKIAVAVSGGKDSLGLLYALAGLKRFYQMCIRDSDGTWFDKYCRGVW